MKPCYFSVNCSMYYLIFFLVIIRSCFCNQTYSFENGYGYVPLSPLTLNFYENHELPKVNKLETIGKIVLLLDTSENMYAQNRIYKLQHALHHWINAVPNDLLLGLVNFNDNADPVIELTSVNQKFRGEFLKAVPSVTQGGCCFGCAVKVAVQMLGTKNSGSTAIFVTAGHNTVPGEDINDVLSLVSHSNITINTIAIGDAADELEQLAWETNGRTYHVPDKNGLLSLIGALLDSLNMVAGEIIGINSIFEAELFSNKKIHDDFFIDFIVPSATISIYYGPEKELNELVVNSTDTYITLRDFEEKDLKQRFFRQSLNKGKWSVSLSYNLINKYAAVLVSGGLLPSEFKANPGVKIKCWHNADMGPVNVKIKPVVIYASVLEGADIAMDVHVIAIISAPNGTMSTLQLLDNGSGADSMKNDGTYSRFYPARSVTGRYSVRFEARRKNSSLITGDKGTGKGKEPFTRVCRTTSFKVTSAPDIYFPAAINDLKIVESNTTYVNICWTATGRQLDWGKGEKYIIKYSRMVSCSGNVVLWTKEVTAPNSPKTFGAPECLPIDYTSYVSFNVCLCISMYVVGEEGLHSPLSNTVEVYCPPINNTTDFSMDQDKAKYIVSNTTDIITENTPDEEITTRNEDGSSSSVQRVQANFYSPVLLIILSIVLLMAITTVIFCLIKHNIFPNVCNSQSYTVCRKNDKTTTPHIVTYSPLITVPPETK